MPKTIYVRNVPEKLHRRLKVRAAKAGMSLSSYILTELTDNALLPTLAESRIRLQSLEPVSHPIDSSNLLRDERND